jgi:hypothetical protein
MRNEFYSYYVEDVMKITSKLTLTLGLRHELPTVVQELGGRQSVLSVTTPNPGAGGRPGALTFLQDGDQLVENYSRAYSPRFGIAYSLNEKTVIRTGFGIFFSPTNATSIGRFSGLFASGFRSGKTSRKPLRDASLRSFSMQAFRLLPERCRIQIQPSTMVAPSTTSTRPVANPAMQVVGLSIFSASCQPSSCLTLAMLDRKAQHFPQGCKT